jgi:sugar phosphate isomerase/epimerase
MPPTGATTSTATQTRAIPERLAGRLGLSVPAGWWPSAPLLKSYEAAGFGWVQVHAPPAAVLAIPSLAHRHAAGISAPLATTSLRAMVHAPGDLWLTAPRGRRAFEGLLGYAAECGAAAVVYHALALPDDPANADRLSAEARALEELAAVAERLEVTIAIENLAPLYPGPETVAASPQNLRMLALRVGSSHLSICLDVGHAHIVAEGRHTGIGDLCDPALDHVAAFHVHDNLGARWPGHEPEVELSIDPLRLDLHLAPGRGTVPWELMAPRLHHHDAPLILEVHPPYRPPAEELLERTVSLLADSGA